MANTEKATQATVKNAVGVIKECCCAESMLVECLGPWKDSICMMLNMGLLCWHADGLDLDHCARPCITVVRSEYGQKSKEAFVYKRNGSGFHVVSHDSATADAPHTSGFKVIFVKS